MYQISHTLSSHILDLVFGVEIEKVPQSDHYALKVWLGILGNNWIYAFSSHTLVLVSKFGGRSWRSDKMLSAKWFINASQLMNDS